MTLRSCLSAVPKQWKTPRTLRILFLIELALSIAALALFGIAEPNLYRTRFWQEGSDQGWNSNPNQIIYAYANYKPISAPLPWSQLYVKAIIGSTSSQGIGTDDVQRHGFQCGHRRRFGLHPSIETHHDGLRHLSPIDLSLRALGSHRYLGG